ncbi:hypothetical protein HYV12_01070 [Candidatus Dojkabacteria bacterium]|nr:hypothetical protein [Candidatus Dojkabacteria bacterium]
MESNQNENKLYILFFLVLSVILLFLSSQMSWLRNYISYVYTNTSHDQVVNGRQVKNYFTLFSEIIEIKNENEKLRDENSTLKSQLDTISFLIEENTQLKKSERFLAKKSKYSEVNMFMGEGLEIGYIDLGSDNGVKKGGVVQYGQYYVGFIDSLDRSSGTVKLPYNRSSFIQVSVIKPTNIEGLNTDQLKRLVSEKTKSKAVAIGKGDWVSVENISTDKGVADGDFVITNDPKIGSYLVLGRIKDLDRDPASSSITSSIEISVNYYDLNRYIIEIQ